MSKISVPLVAFAVIRLFIFVLVIALLPIVFQAPALGAPPSTPLTPKRTSITGNISLYGCSVPASKIRIVALPIEVSLPSRLHPRRTRALRTARPANARVRGGVQIQSDTRFAIPNLNEGVIYKISVGVEESLCGKIFWRGPTEGLAPAGARNLRIEGFAARSEIEIFDQYSDGWVGYDHVDFTDDMLAVRRIRWRSTLPAVQSAELQLATEPFPITGNFGACDEPASSVLYRLELPAAPGLAAGSWQEVPEVNFKRLLPAPDRSGHGLPLGVYRQLTSGRPFYLRVVPISEGRRACDVKRDGVHGWVILAKLPEPSSFDDGVSDPPSDLEIWNNNIYLPPVVDTNRHPSGLESAYRVTKPHLLPPKKCFSGIMTKAEFNFYYYNDPLGCLLVNHAQIKPGSVLQPGKWFWYYQKVSKSGGWNPLTGLGSAFVGLATGTFGAFGSAVNYLHNLSQEIEGALTKSILQIVSAVDLLDACGTLQSAGLSCKSLIKAGLKSGLLAMGVPPITIPNWEQLQGQGYEYMAGVIANEVAGATGVPAELTEDKIKELVQTATAKAVEQITNERQISPTYGYSWIIPYEGFDPALWTLVLRKNLPGDLPKNLHLVRTQPQPALFLGGDTAIPYSFPDSSTLRVPMVLPFNFTTLNAPFCRIDRYLNSTCIENPFSKIPACQVEQLSPGQTQTYTWVSVSCEGYGAPVTRYYRDKWFSTYHEPSGTCFSQMARLYTDVNGLNIPYPFPQLVGFTKLRSSLFSMWNNFLHISDECG